MRLPTDPRRRTALLGGAAVFVIVAILLITAVLDGGDEGPPSTGVQPTASTTATGTAAATATAVPDDTPTPSVTATAPQATATASGQPVTPTPGAQPTSTPTSGPQVNLCAGTLQDAIDDAEAGSVLDMSACTYQGTAKVSKALTLIGGTLISPSSNRQAISLSIEADNVTIDGWSFRGGGNVISVVGRSNVRILNSSFRDHTAGAIALWSAVQGIEIAGNDIVNTVTHKTGIVGGRASEGANPCPVVGRNVTIRNNSADQGEGDVGWFGIELKCFEDVLIEGNKLRGGTVLISLPDSNRVTIRNNTLDLSGSPYYAVEIPKAHNVTIEHNSVSGDGPSKDTAFSANSGSQNLVVRFNVVRNVRTLVDGPLLAVVTDNCIIGVTLVTEFGEPEASVIERNAIC